MSKSTVVRGASKAVNIWSKIDAAVKAKGGSEDALDILDKEEGAALVDVIADVLVKVELKTRNRFPVEVDYTKSLVDMVKAGEYDYVNEYISADNFPITGEGKATSQLVLVNFNRDISSKDAVKEMVQLGLEPAKTEHLLAYGAQHWQRDPLLVVALGSSWVDPGGDRSVPCLDGSGGSRCGLYLGWWGDGWGARWRFLAVRK